MTKRFLFGKGRWLWIGISAALIIAGIVVGCLFGFNQANINYKTVEVTYDTRVVLENKEKDLAERCEKVFEEKGLPYEKKSTNTEMDTGYVAENGNYMLCYTFGEDVTDEVLSATVAAIRTQVVSLGEQLEIGVSHHTYSGEKFTEAGWRGAVALAVAAVVALVYVGFRFGWDRALAGLIACANDTLVSLAIILLARIPVQAFAPVLYAGIALVLSSIFWIMQCMKMRENFKDPSYAALSAEEAVANSVRSSVGFMLAMIIPLVWIFVIFGVIATGGLRLFMMFALIPLAVSVYSSFLLAPAVLVPMKSKFDRIRSTRKRYIGKKKEETQAQA